MRCGDARCAVGSAVIRYFRKKPVVITAVQWTGDNWPVVYMWLMKCGDGVRDPGVTCLDGVVTVTTLEGEMKATEGDWIIQGIAGEFYPCKPHVFDATYEEVTP